MQYELLTLLRCPISKTKLELKLIKAFNKEYSDTVVTEVCDGLLFSETGFVFPVIDGIPRMLIESIYDYSEFLAVHLDNYQQTKKNLEINYRSLLEYCSNKNRQTKRSFEFEWSFLNLGKNDRVWHIAHEEMAQTFSSETGEDAVYFKDKNVIDVGCGHGVFTSRIGEMANLAIGVEISKAVEKAYESNKCKSSWYLQGDLQFLPFEPSSFDVLYSGGVIHHTNNTELSFLLIEPVLKEHGKICLWLYHPQKSIIHNSFLVLRNITKRLPLKIAFAFLIIFIFPLSFLLKKIKGNTTLNYREEIIDLLDHFTPEFRFEIPHDLAKVWLIRCNFLNIKITTQNQFGFSITGDKSRF